jgi:hypothetical protein
VQAHCRSASAWLTKLVLSVYVWPVVLEVYTKALGAAGSRQEMGQGDAEAQAERGSSARAPVAAAG